MLYIVATPIGNLGDLSLRAAKTLVSSDFILTEDTRSTGLLLKYIEKNFSLESKFKPKLISYYKEKEFEKLPEALKLLNENKKVSLISQSGNPLISDPGYLLVKTTIKESLPYTVIPGPSAVITALIHSGFNPQKFMFYGFLPKNEADKIKIFERVKQLAKFEKDLLFVFYESPQRINETFKLLTSDLPNAEVVVARELTKKFEEISRGNATELSRRKFKGEITLILKM